MCSLFISSFVPKANKSKVFYGLLKEPEINIPLDDGDEEIDGEGKPKVSVKLNKVWN